MFCFYFIVLVSLILSSSVAIALWLHWCSSATSFESFSSVVFLKEKLSSKFLLLDCFSCFLFVLFTTIYYFTIIIIIRLHCVISDSATGFWMIAWWMIHSFWCTRNDMSPLVHSLPLSLNEYNMPKSLSSLINVLTFLITISYFCLDNNYYRWHTEHCFYHVTHQYYYWVLIII